jgi:hypothetical protein
MLVSFFVSTPHCGKQLETLAGLAVAPGRRNAIRIRAMLPAQDDVRAALRLLEPKIAEFQARERSAAGQYPPGDPMLESLRHHLDLLQQEWARLHAQLAILGG